MNDIKIGVLSDTHGLLRDEVCEALKECKAIFHGGDINRQDILDRLAEIAPLVVVRGNNDKEWAEHIPYVAEKEIFGLRICMAHKKKDLPADLTGYDLVICGHTHKYDVRKLQNEKGLSPASSAGESFFLNPGSCGPRRLHQEITLAVVSVSEGSVKEIQKIVIPHERKQPEISDKDLRTQIEWVIRDVQRGRSVDQIAEARGTDRDLTEQICRLYLTHPGVDAEGIMRKMGL